VSRFLALCRQRGEDLGIEPGKLQGYLNEQGVYHWKDEKRDDDDHNLRPMSYSRLRQVLNGAAPPSPILMVTIALALDFEENEIWESWNDCGFEKLYAKVLHAALLIGYIRRFYAFSVEDYESRYAWWMEKARAEAERHPEIVEDHCAMDTDPLVYQMRYGTKGDYRQAMKSCVATYGLSDLHVYHFKVAYDRHRAEFPGQSLTVIRHLYHTYTNIDNFLHKDQTPKMRSLMGWCVHLRFSHRECRDVLTHSHSKVVKQQLPGKAELACRDLLLKHYTEPLPEAEFWEQMERIWQLCPREGEEGREAADGLLFGIDGAHTPQGAGEKSHMWLSNRRNILKRLSGHFYAELLSGPREHGYPWIAVEDAFYGGEVMLGWVENKEDCCGLSQNYLPESGDSCNQLLYLFCALAYTLLTRHYFTPRTYRLEHLSEHPQAADVLDRVLYSSKPAFSKKEAMEIMKLFSN